VAGRRLRGQGQRRWAEEVMGLSVERSCASHPSPYRRR
jgi:hypothetical protein